jgi:hypothetical protein
LETEYPDMPENLWEPYQSRRFVLGAQLYGSLGIKRDDKAGRLDMAKRNFQFFNAPVGLFITIDRRLGPGQWADLGGYVSTPVEVRALHIPDNQTRARLAITCEGRTYTADIATKALRKAKGTIAANRVENVFAMVQGKLKGNEIIECGLVAQVKTPKPAVAAAA